MFSVILDEAINGWILTTFVNGDKHTVVYENVEDALKGLEALIRNHAYQNRGG